MEDKMIELTRYETLTQAEMLVNLLKSEGIDSYVKDSSSFYGDATGGAKVELLEKDFGRAQQILNDHGYETNKEVGELIESENMATDNAVFEERRQKLSKSMTLIVILLVILLIALILLNKFLKG
jgi:type III secretory pathway lipoprotein EscJ